MIAIPTNRDLKRIEYPDVIYLTEKEKFAAVAEEVERTTKLDVIQLKDGQQLLGQITKESEAELTVQTKDRQEAKVRRDQIESIDRCGGPVLIGTVSIEKASRSAGCSSNAVSNTRC